MYSNENPFRLPFQLQGPPLLSLAGLILLCACTGTMGGSPASNEGGENGPVSGTAHTTDDADGTAGSDEDGTEANGTAADDSTEASPEPPLNAGDTEDTVDATAGEEAGSDSVAAEEGSDNAGANSPQRTAGCGQTAAGTNQFERHTIDIDGAEREYFLRIPKSYDPERTYPLIYRFHGAGGDGLSGGLDIEGPANQDALIVSPSGENQRWSFRAESGDVKLFDTLLEQLSSTLCIDPRRIYTYGFSSGGTFANLLACSRSDRVAGVVAVSGGTRADSCGGAVAAMIIHGTRDETVPLFEGEAARDQYLALNGCSDNSVPAEPAPCVSYTGCKDGAPVMFCPTDSAHNPQGAFSAPAAFGFFSSLP